MNKKLTTLAVIILILVIIGAVFTFNHSTSTNMSDQTAKNGDHIYVNYVGTLENGTKFDSSYDRGQPIDFVLGTGHVIPGWDKGIVGMKIGDKKHLVIPPADAYGAQGITDREGNAIIPPNATLIFDIELVKNVPSTSTSAAR